MKNNAQTASLKRSEVDSAVDSADSEALAVREAASVSRGYTGDATYAYA